MSKLGVHVASSNRRGFGEILDAGPAVIVAIDQGVVAEVRQRAPQAKIAFRTQQPDGLDNPPNLLETPIGSIPALAVTWCESRYPIWQLNQGADFYIVNNELDISTLDSAAKLNTFFMACMVWCEQHGLKAGICSFSTGCPSDDGGLTLEQRWEPLLQSIQYASTGGHAVILHAHALDHGPLSQTGEDIAYRHERSLRYFAAHDLYPMVIIGEVSNGVGGVEPDVPEYMAQVSAWDLHVMQPQWRRQVIGGALYGFNAAETLTPVYEEIAAWIASHPTPIDPPPPDTEYEFVEWVDGVTGLSLGNANPLTFTITADRQVRAVFQKKVPPPIKRTCLTSVTPDGAGTVTGGGVYNDGDVVTLTAVAV